MSHLVVILKWIFANIGSQTRLIFKSGFSSFLYDFLTILNFLKHTIWHASYLYLTWTFFLLFFYFNLRRPASIRMLAWHPCNWIFSHYVKGHYIRNYTNWSSIQEWMNDFWRVIICSNLTLWLWRFLKRCRITTSFK